VDEGQHAAGAAHPVVVAERLGDPDRLLGQPPGPAELAGGHRPGGPEPEGGGGDPPVTPQEPLDGRRQQRLGRLVPVLQVQDDPLEGPGGVDHEGVAGRLGDLQGLDAERPGGAEVGEEPPDPRQGKAQGAQGFVPPFGGDLQGLLRGVELEPERAGRVGDQRDPGQQAGLEPGPVLRRPADGPSQELDALGPVAVQVPQPGQPGRQAAAWRRVRGGQPPLQGRA
jgi:hypothetical protein